VLRTVVVDGVERDIGQLMDFTKHSELSSFLPEVSSTSLSWVHLDSGQILETHVHPVASMVIVADGSGCTRGDAEVDIQAGDVVMIPAGVEHGFVGAGNDGFWALSLQFEGRGLYQDPENPLVIFKTDCLDSLLSGTRRRSNTFRKNRIFGLVESGALDDRETRRLFLRLLQVWSDAFASAMLARSALTENASFAAVFRTHLNEEFGHDDLFDDERGDERSLPRDAVLRATSQWFTLKMLTLDDADKAVLVHLVLEAAASTFMPIARPVIGAYETGMTYFDVHDEADEEHTAMVASLLSDLDAKTCQRLRGTLDDGWDMFEAMCERIAELTVASQSAGH
jgi:quercetin dioxygenase-like cupin family protein